MRCDSQSKALSKRAKNYGKFQGSYARGSNRPTLTTKPIQSSMPATTGNYSGTLYNICLNIQSIVHAKGPRLPLDHTCFN